MGNLPQIPTPRGVTPPKYNLAARLRHSWISDDRLEPEVLGQRESITGIVAGAVFNHPDWRCPGWIYYLLLDEQYQSAHHGCYLDVPEHELEVAE